MRRHLATALFALSAFTLSNTVLAVDTAKLGMRQTCAPDIQHFCAGIQPGGGRIMQCMKTHGDAVSFDCNTAMLNAKSAKQARKQAAPAASAPAR
jgi:hypothetical protein